ncbi:TIGR01620 family protein [Leisingera caerulea]|uniref:TIGR01620 family protein n=1 Tax=Leisingera caerulea TaxID=506591 RepID=A0A9Q9LZV3_LEICA|nr:YcjF family protein [Leisingera caerulea]UWQ52972.1 TIGR01620 family protein [Leisingera caerulea]UWQ57540.1 TIGR01620 family protein [Leisingera caerulea]UWQ82668.1 TIGR01620 family protein [Leisingera caerulea]
MSKKPVLFELDEDAGAPPVAEAPPVPEPAVPEPLPPSAMEQAARIAARKPSRLARWFWALLVAVVGAMASVAAWDFATGLIARVPVLGWAVSAGLALLLLLALAMGLRELAALSRLRRVDTLRHQAAEVADLAAARAFTNRLEGFYKGREDLTWHQARLAERQAEVLDGDALLLLAEEELLVPLDALALREVEAAARQVATVTAIVPMALADILTALVSSLRMIRRVAGIYGGRPGVFSSWRLTRAVLAHLAATGAVAAGDDLLEPVLGGSVLSKLSRRFGEGLVNGALSARVGIAAMEVCRPMPFSQKRKPSTRKVVQRALTGLFSKEK